MFEKEKKKEQNTILLIMFLFFRLNWDLAEKCHKAEGNTFLIQSMRFIKLFLAMLYSIEQNIIFGSAVAQW